MGVLLFSDDESRANDQREIEFDIGEQILDFQNRLVELIAGWLCGCGHLLILCGQVMSTPRTKFDL